MFKHPNELHITDKNNKASKMHLKSHSKTLEYTSLSEQRIPLFLFPWRDKVQDRKEYDIHILHWTY